MVRPGRYAAIDIGTVTCRMLVADVAAGEDGAPLLSPLAKEYAVTNLGEGVDETRRLSAAALNRVAAAVDGFVATLAELDTPEHPLVDTLVMATSASRDAENADEFAALMQARGLKLNVISGQTEARMSFMGASHAFAGQPVMVVDVGGGSTEVSLGVAGSNPVASHSYDIGCRRVTERFWDGYPPSASAIDAARTWIREELRTWKDGFKDDVRGSRAERPENSSESNEKARRAAYESEAAKRMSEANSGAGNSSGLSDGFPSREPFRMIAVAGTATSAVSIRERMEVYDADRVHGSVVTRDDLSTIVDDLSAKTLPELEHVTGLDPRRAPVIVAGMVILQEVMAAFGVDRFTASESDILEGMIMYNSVERPK